MKLNKKELDAEIWKQYRDTPYEVSNFGRCRRIYKSGKIRVLTPFRKTQKKGGYYMLVKVHGKATKLSTMIWETFNGPIPGGHCVCHRNKIPSINELSNLELLALQQAGAKHGGNTSQRKLVYDIDNQKFYRGCRSAAKALYISKQTVCDICNGKRKRDPVVNIRWAYEDE